jgi:hypothetical protein
MEDPFPRGTVIGEQITGGRRLSKAEHFRTRPARWLCRHARSGFGLKITNSRWFKISAVAPKSEQ